MKKDFLLHICCAPCGGGCVERLKNESAITPVLYYSNSNLCSSEEFERRLESVKCLAEAYGLELKVDPYDHAAWLKHIAGLESEPERGRRCERCFEWNLRRTAQAAAENGAVFATTLTVSPQKSSKTIFAAAEGMADFEPWDFKKKNGYKISCEIAEKLNFYRQKFCGCEFSKRESKCDTSPASDKEMDAEKKESK